MELLTALIAGTWLIGFFLYARHDKRIKDLTSNSNGMSIMLEHLLSEAGIEREDWAPIMKAAIERDIANEESV